MGSHYRLNLNLCSFSSLKENLWLFGHHNNLWRNTTSTWCIHAYFYETKNIIGSFILSLVSWFLYFQIWKNTLSNPHTQRALRWIHKRNWDAFPPMGFRCQSFPGLGMHALSTRNETPTISSLRMATYLLPKLDFPTWAIIVVSQRILQVVVWASLHFSRFTVSKENIQNLHNPLQLGWLVTW